MDSQPGDRPNRPAYLRPVSVGVVWAGGVLGTGARYVLTGEVPRLLGVPVVTIGINVVGAFALGLLLESLLRRGPDQSRRRVLRLLLGTGFLGGFTTYSALSMDTVTLLRAGATGLAVGYAAVTVLVGGLAALLGVTLGGRLRTGGRAS